ncbi:type IV pilin protein [Lysobacter xanthus]
MNSNNVRNQAGFTLIELMVVVAIVAILAAIAVPSYQQSVIKSRRNSAAGCMLGVAQYLERYYTTKLTYVGAALPTAQCLNDLGAYYTLSLATPTATTYTVTATPKGAQLKDTKCNVLTIDQRGTKSVTGSSPVKDCF